MTTQVLQSDLEILHQFPAYAGLGQTGYIIDFLGTRTRTSYIRPLAHLSGAVEGYPVPGNFHATTLEWAGALRAVLDARDQFVAAELGAGWGPWLVATAAAARARGIEDIRLVGIEGCPGHCEFMRAHFRDNGLDPAAHRLVHGVVGARDGWAEFDAVKDPAAVYGATPCFENLAEMGRRRWPLGLGGIFRWWWARSKGQASANSTEDPIPPGRVRVRCYSLESLLAEYECLDLVHVDIQGSEAELVSSAQRVLKQKVRRLLIGTHGREIEENLRTELTGRGWMLEAEESCLFEQNGQIAVLYRDGCQVWRNPDLAD
jgi:FkbM family methyltransferase